MKHLLSALILAAMLPLSAWAQAPNNPSFNLVNRSANIINEVYASPAGMTNWGQDRLGNATIAPGGTGPIRLPADGNCIYDVQVVYANGAKDERRGLNTCTLDSVVFPAGAAPATRGATNDPSFRLVNRGRSAVNEVYATLTGDTGWGADRLGDETVPVGGNRVIRLPQGSCNYDVKVVYADGKATEKRRLNLCTIENLTVP